MDADLNTTDILERIDGGKVAVHPSRHSEALFQLVQRLRCTLTRDLHAEHVVPRTASGAAEFLSVQELRNEKISHLVTLPDAYGEVGRLVIRLDSDNCRPQ